MGVFLWRVIRVNVPHLQSCNTRVAQTIYLIQVFARQCRVTSLVVAVVQNVGGEMCSRIETSTIGKMGEGDGTVATPHLNCPPPGMSPLPQWLSVGGPLPYL